MRSIRSLLWIGSGDGLARSGLTEAPELDVTWVPTAPEADRLPAVRFDGVLYEIPDSSLASGEARFEELIARLERFAPRHALMLVATDEGAATLEESATKDIGAMFVFDPEAQGPGFVTELNEALDRIHARRAAERLSTACVDAATGNARPAGDPPDTREATRESRSIDVREPVDENAPGDPMICESVAMQEVSDLVDLAASSPSTVLVTGETGVGKEVVARSLHARSARDEEPFVAINCAAFPEALLESELFGHAKGAFTGADRSRRGLFEAAGRGTLFLDEVAETSLGLQAKLLRVLQEREVRAVGETTARPIHCRIVAATNRVLAREVERKRFREDLFYRLNVFPIQVPPLRERRADILPLARSFLARHGVAEGKPDCHLSLAAGHLLEAHHWPGNVRELENEMLRALMLVAPGALITPRDLSPKLAEILEPIAEGARPDETLREALDRIEAWLLRRALANNGGRKARTARRLGLTREGLYKKLKRLGIE